MQCEHRKDDGERCGAHALRGGTLCWAHDPEKAAERRAASSRGGKRSTRRHDVEDITLSSVEDVRALLEWTVNQFRRGDIGTGTARVLARLVSESRKTVETADLERRIEAIEDQLRKDGQTW